MIETYKIKGLNKLINSSIIKEIYPMVDNIVIRYEDTSSTKFWSDIDRIDVEIFLNDELINNENMYDYDFDPHYLIDHHIKKYLPYFDIDKVIIDFTVLNPDGEIIHSWKN